MDTETKALPQGPTMEAQKKPALDITESANKAAELATRASSDAVRERRIATRNLEIASEAVLIANQNVRIAMDHVKEATLLADNTMKSISQAALTMAIDLEARAKGNSRRIDRHVRKYDPTKATDYLPDTESHMADIVHEQLGYEPSDKHGKHKSLPVDASIEWTEAAANDLTVFAWMFGKMDGTTVKDWVQVWKAMQDKGWRFPLRELTNRWFNEVYPKISAARASAEALQERIRNSKVDSEHEAIAKAKQEAHRIEMAHDSFPLDPLPSRDQNGDNDDDGYRLPATTYNPDEEKAVPAIPRCPVVDPRISHLGGVCPGPVEQRPWHIAGNLGRGSGRPARPIVPCYRITGDFCEHVKGQKTQPSYVKDMETLEKQFSTKTYLARFKKDASTAEKASDVNTTEVDDSTEDKDKDKDRALERATELSEASSFASCGSADGKKAAELGPEDF